jgi:hypothetical protein
MRSLAHNSSLVEFRSVGAIKSFSSHTSAPIRNLHGDGSLRYRQHPVQQLSSEMGGF